MTDILFESADVKATRVFQATASRSVASVRRPDGTFQVFVLQPGQRLIVPIDYEFVLPASGQAVTVPPPPVTAPVADFSGTPLTGETPLSVTFTDLSQNTPTSWLWEYNDGEGWTQFSTVQSPVYEFEFEASYSIRMTATNAGGSDTETKASYVSVSPPPPPPPPVPTPYLWYNFNGNGNNTGSAGGSNLSFSNESYTTGKLGQALSATGAASAPGSFLPFNPSGITLSAWFYIDVTQGGTEMTSLGLDYGSYSLIPNTGLTPGQWQIDIYGVPDGGDPFTPLASIVVNTTGWHHVVAAFSPTDYTVWLNESISATGSVALILSESNYPSVSLGPITIGVPTDLCGIWLQTLNGADVDQLYNGGVGFDPTA